MSKSTLVVGDLHGRHEIVSAVLELTDKYNVVFIGDYLDSFTRSVNDQILTLKLVLDACQASPDKVQALLGNHELSYMDAKYRCSGYSPVTQIHIMPFLPDMHNHLKKYIWVGDWLITHAGVSQFVLDYYCMDLQEYLDSPHLFDIGQVRDGRHEQGGIFWNDFNWEMVPVPGLKQVVGHTNSVIKSDKCQATRIMTGPQDAIVINIDHLSRSSELLCLTHYGHYDTYDLDVHYRMEN